MTEYPTEYRGNLIYDEKQVSELPERLELITDQYEVNHTLDHIGVSHNPESPILQDSYSCLLAETDGGGYTQVWGIHKSVPRVSDTAVRLR